MAPFDPNAYRKEVLKPLLEGRDGAPDDAFALIGLDPSVDDDATIGERLDHVVAFWRKEQSSPRYKGVVGALLGRRAELTQELLDPASRADLRATLAARSAVDATARFARLDELLDTLVRRAGGIPRDRIDRLRALAVNDGVSAAEFDERLAGLRIIDDAAVEPIAEPVRRQVRRLLDELARLEARADGGRRYRDLYDLLGVEPTASAPDIASHREQIGARNRQRRHDRTRTVVDELLAQVTTLLLDGDPARYRAAVLEDVREALRPQMETALLVEDRITAQEFERVTREAVAAGLVPAAARSLVASLARSMSAPVEMGQAVDYVVCAACNGTNPRRGVDQRCETCGEPLHGDCPSCGHSNERVAVRCGTCGYDLRAAAAVAADVAQARDDLAAGLVDEAGWRLDQLGDAATRFPDVAAVAAEVASARSAASEAWEALAAAIAAERWDDASDRVGFLERTASDVAGPDGSGLAAARATVGEGQTTLVARVEALADADPADREAALVQLSADHPGSAVVLAALRAVPVAAPSRVSAIASDRAVAVAWRPSSSVGEIEHRVTRVSTLPDGTETRRPVARTAAAAVEDAGVAPGELVSYQVVAVRDGISSGVASSGQLRFVPEVADLASVTHDGAIELRWGRRGGAGQVWVERTEPEDPSIAAQRSRGGSDGHFDSYVASARRYRYRVFVEYPDVNGPPVRTEGVAIEVVGFVAPEPVSDLEVVTVGAAIRATVPHHDAGVRHRVLRAAAAPASPPGTIVDAARLAETGGGLPGDGATAFDQADGPARWYVPVSVVADRAVLGTAVLHPGVAEVGDLRVERHDDTGEPMARWAWPLGCTEALVAWSADRAPAGVVVGAEGVAKVTNMSYDLKGGWPLGGLPAGPIHLLVVSTARVGGVITALPGWSDGSRLIVPASRS